MPSVHAGDLDVHYAEHGTGQPVIFVHGNWATSSWWERVFQHLPAGLRGIAYDVRGRGRTQGPDHDYSISALAEDLHAFASALEISRFHLVGHSLGSAIAMQFALEYGPRVISLAAVSPAWVDGMPAAYYQPAGQQALKADKVFFGQAIKMLAPAASNDGFWQRLVDEGHNQRLEAALRNLDALRAWKPGDRLQAIAAALAPPSVGSALPPQPAAGAEPTLGDARVVAIASPRVLVVCGALDVLTGGANAERAAAALGARLVWLAGVGHSPPVEAPAALVDVLQSGWRDE